MYCTAAARCSLLPVCEAAAANHGDNPNLVKEWAIVMTGRLVEQGDNPNWD